MFISEENLRKHPGESTMFTDLTYCANDEETQKYPRELINTVTTSDIFQLNLT